jgi:hypothetical protein
MTDLNSGWQRTSQNLTRQTWIPPPRPPHPPSLQRRCEPPACLAPGPLLPSPPRRPRARSSSPPLQRRSEAHRDRSVSRRFISRLSIAARGGGSWGGFAGNVPGAADLGLGEATAPTPCSVEDAAAAAIGPVPSRVALAEGVAAAGWRWRRWGRFIGSRWRLGEGRAEEEARRGRRRARGEARSSFLSAARWGGRSRER